MLNIDDVQVGVKELERCANLGHVGAMITVYPTEDRPYDSPEYEPLWAAAQDLADATEPPHHYEPQGHDYR